LIELLVVILIIGILIAVAAPSFLGQTQKAHDSVAKQYLTVAYREAAADAVDRDAQFVTTDYDEQNLADALTASEPGLTFAPGSCPTDATTDQKHIIIDTAYTDGRNLRLCNDPLFNGDRRVWTLTVTNGILGDFPAEPTLVSGDGPGGVVDTGNPGDGNTVTVTVDNPADPSTTIDPTDSNCVVDCTDWTIHGGPNGDPNNPTTVTITILNGDPNTTITKNGDVIPDCDNPGSGVAVPDPCVDTRNNDGGNAVIVIDSTSNDNDQYSFSASPSEPDQDGDGIPDTSDNCPSVANPSQENGYTADDASAGADYGDLCSAPPGVTAGQSQSPPAPSTGTPLLYQSRASSASTLSSFLADYQDQASDTYDAWMFTPGVGYAHETGLPYRTTSYGQAQTIVSFTHATGADIPNSQNGYSNYLSVSPNGQLLTYLDAYGHVIVVPLGSSPRTISSDRDTFSMMAADAIDVTSGDPQPFPTDPGGCPNLNGFDAHSASNIHCDDHPYWVSSNTLNFVHYDPIPTGSYFQPLSSFASFYASIESYVYTITPSPTTVVDSWPHGAPDWQHPCPDYDPGDINTWCTGLLNGLYLNPNVFVQDPDNGTFFAPQNLPSGTPASKSLSDYDTYCLLSGDIVWHGNVVAHRHGNMACNFVVSPDGTTVAYADYTGTISGSAASYIHNHSFLFLTDISSGTTTNTGHAINELSSLSWGGSVALPLAP
jgi:type II secretory pathway pseudopilin PulG